MAEYTGGKPQYYRAAYVANFHWVNDPENMFFTNTIRYNQAIHNAVYEKVNEWAPVIEDWMRENAAWEDKKGLARRLLEVTIDEVFNRSIDVNFVHGVFYGRFLETLYGGRFAILQPAMDKFGPLMWKDIQEIMIS